MSSLPQTAPPARPSPKTPATVAVIGAGPAGLMAAETVASSGCGHRVEIFEAMPSPARKFLMAGRGGLNLTHSEPMADFLSRYEDPGGTTRSAVEAFTPADLVAWADTLGIETFVGSSGRVFPRQMKASPLLRAWLRRLDSLGVSLHTRMRWTGWDAHGALLFESHEPGGKGKGKIAIRADAVILAMGGASWPRLGSDGKWAGILAREGIDIAPLRAFNCGVAIGWSKPLVDRFHGTPLKRIAVTCGDMLVRGEAIITRNGLEGGAIYAINAAIMRALDSQPSATILINLRPDLDRDELTRRLSTARGRQSASNFLRKTAGLSPAAIAIAREPLAGGLPDTAEDLARLIKAVPLEVHAMGGIDSAISSAGGVHASQLDPHAMLTARPGTFVAGEMLDWAAPTGGYLLQATFASAVRAGNGALNWLGGQAGAGQP